MILDDNALSIITQLFVINLYWNWYTFLWVKGVFFVIFVYVYIRVCVNRVILFCILYIPQGVFSWKKGTVEKYIRNNFEEKYHSRYHLEEV